MSPPPFGAGGRPALEDPEQLAALREELYSTHGEDAPATLYALGFVEGMADGLRIAQGFGADELRPCLAGPGLPLLFVPETEQDDPVVRIAGTVENSLEARIHRAQGLCANEPSCHLSAGYAAGWYGEILRERLIVKEVECMANGGTRCRFVAHTPEEWQAARDPWIEQLLSRLDFASLRAAAASRPAALSGDLDADEPEGDTFGGFDPMSPAVHVWGPVMVLPYSGAADGEAAVEMVSADLDADRIKIAVVDVTGVRIESVEADGLARFLDHLERLQIEAVLVGLSPEAQPLFQDQGCGLAMPMLARDISEGIAFAFQLAHGTTSSANSH
jgi:hypothetical protein